MNRFVIAAAILTLSATACLAGEGAGNPFSFTPPAATMPSSSFAMLPSTGSEAGVASANSAPRGFEEGTQADQVADAVRDQHHGTGNRRG